MSLHSSPIIHAITRTSGLALSGAAFAGLCALTFAATSAKLKIESTPAAVILKSGKTIDGGYMGGDQHTIYLVQDGKLVAIKTADVDTLLFPEHLAKRSISKPQPKKRPALVSDANKANGGK